MALLGDDGLGFELARKLETCGVWRSWLGDSNYTAFVHSLSSPSAWEAFMRNDTSKTRVQIQLQLRARALLFDKASVSLFLRSSPSNSSSASKLNPSYLQLHGDDVYFSLEDFSYCSQEGGEGSSSSSLLAKTLPKRAFNAGLKYEPDVDKRDEFPETWYNHFIEKYRASRHHKLLYGDREPHKRTSEGMSTYLKLLERHKKSRQPFKEDQYVGNGKPVWENGSDVHPNSVSDVNNSTDDEAYFFPEVMFPSNCVPDSAIPHINRVEDVSKVECYGVLDNLPHVMTRSPAMLERFGIRPDYLRIGLGRSKYRGKNGLDGNGKSLDEEQALLISQKVIARMLANLGFDGATEVPMEVLSQFLSCHICKLGRILKVLTDNYRKQCSAIEILKMFIRTVGYGNLGTLVEYVKDGTRNFPHPTQHVPGGPQPGFQSQHQSSNMQTQQIPRQMNPQMQLVHSQAQNLTLQQQQLQQQMMIQQQQQQQQWDRIRRRQPSTPRPGMGLEKDRPMMDVKIENISESPMDANAFNPIYNSRNQQMQLRQQHMVAAMANIKAQSGHQFKQMASLQVPQPQTQNSVPVRAPPVKVEGFSELMGGGGGGGGDTTMKHDSEENKLTSPSK